MKVLLLCAKAFETMEFSVFIDVMGWARESFGNDVHVHTCGFQKQVISTFNVPMQMDVLIDEVDVKDYDALAILGGFREFGFKEEAFHAKTKELIRAFHEKGKPIATVCVAAFALAESGILTGKRATVYHLDGGKTQQELAEYGVNVINEPIVVDGNIITSYCPETAAGVAFRLLEMLIGTERMQEVKYAMGYEC
ncbi:MAG: DJ-1/PfpI family protein [Lachnospiraceae bacterium]|nr:DJ-1/PfpI family protein [Lachnospiraceae bacterium]